MIRIRKGTIKDIPKIKECLIDSWVWHAKNAPELLEEKTMRQSKVEEYYKEALKNPKKSFVLVAEIDGKFAGFQRADIQEIPKFFKYNKILYLDDGYVLPEFRRRGIATLLIEEVEKIARQNKIKRLQSRVYTFNKPVHKLLTRLGYKSPHATWDKVIS